MAHEPSSRPFGDLFDALKGGRITRRRFVESATGLGMTLGMAVYCADAVGAQTPAASPGASGAATRPTFGTENQKRGQGGDLKIIQWQAPSQLFGWLATGDKDNLGATPVNEPLMYRLPTGDLIPCLAKDVPTVANGLLAKDLTSVTFNVLDGVKWSDGQPFTAKDVVFTINWVKDPANNAVTSVVIDAIKTIEAPDDQTVKVTFSAATPNWADPFTGSGTGMIPAHVLEGKGKDAAQAYGQKPIGTGPYKVDSFTVNDQVIYSINDNYREPTKPYFKRVIIKGGGDPTSAARAVIQTGEYQFAWNLAVEPEVLKAMVKDNTPGKLYVAPSTSIERININFSDPNKEVDGQRSHFGTPNPVFSDKAVRQAMAIGVDREKIANTFYFGGEDEPAVANILSGIPSMESKNTKLVFDTAQANKILDDAGWKKEGSVRKKDGVELHITYATTINSVRQKTQAVVKSNLEAAGFKVDLKQIESSVFFDASPGNDQGNRHFFNDLNMFTSAVGAPPPVPYMGRWYAGPKGENICQKENNWSKDNFQRYSNPEYDKLYDEARVETDPEKSAQLFIQMNDVLYNDAAVLPLVRTGTKVAFSRTLNDQNLALGGFEFDYWNIANWNEKPAS